MAQAYARHTVLLLGSLLAGVAMTPACYEDAYDPALCSAIQADEDRLFPELMQECWYDTPADPVACASKEQSFNEARQRYEDANCSGNLVQVRVR